MFRNVQRKLSFKLHFFQYLQLKQLIMASRRQQKYAKLIKEELAAIFIKEGRHLINNNIVSVTEVEMSTDLSVAKIYFGFLMEGNKPKVFENIVHHKSEIRKHLGNRIGKQVRKIPELIFYMDKGAEHAERMNEIFKNLHIPPEEKGE